MGKSMIIEAQDSSLVYEEGQKGVLGKLSGVFANFRTGTRNGGRLYNEELIDKRIFGNEDVMEALETRTLFGELDHPEGDRCETLAQNAAVSIIKLEKDEGEGVVKGDALILDTPSGRTLKALVDSGAQMGISSRGIGEEIIENGQTIIDPDTYDFITFDIVVTPANKGARLSLVESKQKGNTLYKNIEKEIENCTSANQLNQIKKVVESTIKAGKVRLVKMIENKIATLSSDEDITDTKSEDINKGNEDIIPTAKEELVENNTDKLEENKELEKASSSLLRENKSLVERLEKAEKLNKLLEAKLKESRKSSKSSRISLEEGKHLNSETIRKLKKINESKLKNVENTYKDEIENLKESLKVSEKDNTKLVEANKKLSQKGIENAKLVESISTELTKTKSLLEESNSKLKTETDKVRMLEGKVKTIQLTNKSKLEESKKQENQEITNLKQKLEEANNKLSKMTEANNRISKLPFDVTSANLKYEGYTAKEVISDDEQALFNAMVNINKR